MNYHKNLSLKDLEGEKWVPIVGHEGLYEISNLGRVKSLQYTSDRIMKQNKSMDGYLSVSLFNWEGKDKRWRVHRLVGIAFIPNPEKKEYINHKKGIKIDNRASELEWNTMSENHKHAYSTGLRKSTWKDKKWSLHPKSKPVSQFTKDGKYINTFGNSAEAAIKLGIVDSHIGSVCTGKRQTTGGYVWKYA